LFYLDNKKPNAVGGVLKDDFIKVSLRQFGSFSVMLDTIAPEITALNIHQGKNINGYKKITFEIKDDLSGIKSYRATLNNQWVLIEYDPKNNRLTYFIDHRMKKGKNTFSLEVIDGRKNRSSFKAEVNF